MIIYSEGATLAQETEAQDILEALTIAYPGHPWGVRVYDGGFFIRHLDFDGSWGMNCKHTTKAYSASALKRQVILMAGEWLERAGLARGRLDPEDNAEGRRIEGVPEKDQPKEYKPPVEAAIVGADGLPIRSAPLPAVERIAQAEGTPNG